MTELKDLVDAANIQLHLQEEVERLEGILKGYKEQLRRQSQEIVPNMMAEIGIDSFALPDGFKVTIKDEVYAKIPEGTADQAFEWLRENNLDGIIKTQVSADFSKGEDNEAQRALDLLSQAGIHANAKSTIHPMTLKAFLKEQITIGSGVPLDLFGATVVKTTMIKQ